MPALGFVRGIRAMSVPPHSELFRAGFFCRNRPDDSSTGECPVEIIKMTSEGKNHDIGSGTPPLALRPREAAKALGIGSRLLWQQTNAGTIPHLRVGRAVLYPVEGLREWLRDRAAKESR